MRVLAKLKTKKVRVEGGCEVCQATGRRWLALPCLALASLWLGYVMPSGTWGSRSVLSQTCTSTRDDAHEERCVQCCISEILKFQIECEQKEERRACSCQTRGRFRTHVAAVNRAAAAEPASFAPAQEPALAPAIAPALRPTATPWPGHERIAVFSRPNATWCGATSEQAPSKWKSRHLA